ncbi:hypothetical protein [Microlunatus flavus]|nr:hypothetical protein [Microlunatus flavus]
MGHEPVPPQQPYQPQPATPKTTNPKRFGIFALGGAGLAGVLIGAIVVGAASGGSKDEAAAPAPAPTVTVTTTAPAAPVAATPSDDPTTDDTSDSTTYEPKKSDFKLGVKTLSKECFGSAGCNVSFRIKPSYVGSQDLPTSGEIEVTYKITGLQDPVENTFTVDGEGTITYTKEEDGQTQSKGDKLGAKVTDVEYTP